MKRVLIFDEVLALNFFWVKFFDYLHRFCFVFDLILRICLHFFVYVYSRWVDSERHFKLSNLLLLELSLALQQACFCFVLLDHLVKRGYCGCLPLVGLMDFFLLFLVHINLVVELLNYFFKWRYIENQLFFFAFYPFQFVLNINRFPFCFLS